MPEQAIKSDLLEVNLGPQHPSTLLRSNHAIRVFLLCLFLVDKAQLLRAEEMWKKVSTETTTPTSEADSRPVKLARSQILEIADREARRLGFDVERMSVAFDYENRPWGVWFKNGDAPWTNPELVSLKEKLRTKSFLAVMYGPMQEALGGELFVFIDRQTGEVIESLIPQYGPQGAR